MIGTIGLRQARIFVALGFPVEIAAINDYAANRIAVAVEELGGRMDDNIGAMLERAAESWRCHGVVDDQQSLGYR